MIIPILCVTAPANWRLAEAIKARLQALGHEGRIAAWMREIPENEGTVIYIGRLDAKTIGQYDPLPVRVFAINAETTTFEQLDFDQILGIEKKGKPYGTERKPRRHRGE